jgi:hypothetical protein
MHFCWLPPTLLVAVPAVFGTGGNVAAQSRRLGRTCQPTRVAALQRRRVWPNFRFGARPGVPFPDSQLPTTAVDELASRQIIEARVDREKAANATRLLDETLRKVSVQ